MLSNRLHSFILASSLIALAPAAFASEVRPELIAQVTINSSGVVNGTIAPPNINPNFNQGTTRVDTDSQGRYFRNGVLVYSAQDFNPNLVQVDSSGRYFVDFRGIPVVSVGGALVSPALSNGELLLVKRFNNRENVRFYGTIQDEFVVLGKYTGIATDPNTGTQYQGTFDVRGQGPRYSDRNGGSSPTVFDFRSHYNTRANPSIPAQPTVFSYTVTNMPVRLSITVPAGLTPISPTSPSPTPISPTSPTPISPTLPGSTPLSPPSNGTPQPSVNPANSDASVLRSLGAAPFFEVNRVVLESARTPAQSIGPRSRVLLR
ncbi:MAG: hypothetical protein KME43_10475 [Myxacorys chilensis ATA2-1-KO14]|jgi:hypothetical protein|nr:hypothetical protein [Myxacorys chilensis ATA2-1-KO14]